MKPPGLLLKITSALLYVFLYAPTVVVILYSFNASRHSTVWTGFTTKWYGTLANNSLALAATRNTIILAVTSTLISTVLGTMLGYGLKRYPFRGQKFLQAMLQVPVFIPDIVMAIGFLMFYELVRQWCGLFQLGLTTMILAHVTFQIPFVAIIIGARLAGLDPALAEAARDLGANEWQTFRRITLPLIVPGILAGAMLAFTLSMDDFVVSFFTTGPGAQTLPILIYSSVKRGLTPDINALAALMFLASLLGTVTLTLLQRKKTARP